MRIRTIKPEFWSHRMHNSISETTSLLAIGLLSIADDDGRLVANPRVIECALFPVRPPKKKVSSCLDELEAVGFLRRYEAEMDGNKLTLAVIMSWNKHQVISKPYPSRLAPPPFQYHSRNGIGMVSEQSQTDAAESKSNTSGDSDTVPESFQSDSVSIPDKEGKGREGKGVDKERNGKEGIREEEGIEGIPSLQDAEGGCQPEPEVAPKRSSKYSRAKTKEIAKGILAHLNEKTGCDYQFKDAILEPIAIRLEEVDLDTEGVKTMVDRQCALWKGDLKMDKYLRPKTLFAASNFHDYYGARELPVEPKGKAGPDYSKGF